MVGTRRDERLLGLRPLSLGPGQLLLNDRALLLQLVGRRASSNSIMTKQGEVVRRGGALCQSRGFAGLDVPARGVVFTLALLGARARQRRLINLRESLPQRRPAFVHRMGAKLDQGLQRKLLHVQSLDEARPKGEISGSPLPQPSPRPRWFPRERARRARLERFTLAT